jgi:hypothetical protein
MMKKMAVIGLFVLLASANAFSSVIFEAKGIYFSPSDKSFKDIYGSGWMAGGEIGFRIIRRLDVWFGGAYFSREGNLTFTQEKTKLSIQPIEGGLRFRFTTGMISCYASAGLNHYQYKESNPIGEVKATAIGYVGKLGIFMKIVDGLQIDFNLGYSYCKMKPADFEINVGGLEAAAGLAIEF